MIGDPKRTRTSGSGNRWKESVVSLPTREQENDTLNTLERDGWVCTLLGARNSGCSGNGGVRTDVLEAKSVALRWVGWACIDILCNTEVYMYGLVVVGRDGDVHEWSDRKRGPDVCVIRKGCGEDVFHVSDFFCFFACSVRMQVSAVV